MAYQYRGNQKGNADPWQQPPPKQPRPDRPHVPGLAWDGRRGHWTARVQHAGQRQALGSFPAHEYEKAVAAIEAARAALPPKPPKPAPPAKVRELRPCGTHAAYQRHKRRGEPVDAACQRAEYEYTEQHRKGKAA